MEIPESFLEEVMARNDIVDVVSEYVQLTKRSGSNQFGLCPFHSEKTPSFSVSPDKQIYKCFGCGKGGNVIGFIMEIEGLPFRDAVELLAKRAGLQMPDTGGDTGLQGRRARILELNRQAALWFVDNLSKPECSPAVEYIRKRQLTRRTVRAFGIGAAPDAWGELSDEMRRRGYSDQELIDAGLAKRGKNGGIYDVFRGRLVFPVIDVRKNVVGFSGRILGSDEGTAKYLNTPDTMVFTKSRNLFALNLAKRSKRSMFILAEGNVDVVMLHQAGFDCAVASLGTSLTQEQARLMKQYKENVVIAYDSDSAGVKAAQRAIGLLEPAGLNVRVLRMEGAKDPDEFIKLRGADAFEVLLERSSNHVEYRIQSVRDKYDITTEDGRLGYLREATEVLASNPSPVERELYAGRIARETGISPEAVKNELNNAVRRRGAIEKKRRERQTMRPEISAQPAARSLRYTNPASARAEEGIVRYLMADPELSSLTSELREEDFTAPFLGHIYADICRRVSDGREVSPALIMTALSPEESAQFTKIISGPVSLGAAPETLRAYIKKIKTEAIRSSPDRDRALAEIEKQKRNKGMEDKGNG